MLIESSEINICSYRIHTHTHLHSCIIGYKIDLIFKLSTDIRIRRTALIQNRSNVKESYVEISKFSFGMFFIIWTTEAVGL